MLKVSQLVKQMVLHSCRQASPSTCNWQAALSFLVRHCYGRSFINTIHISSTITAFSAISNLCPRSSALGLASCIGTQAAIPRQYQLLSTGNVGLSSTTNLDNSGWLHKPKPSNRKCCWILQTKLVIIAKHHVPEGKWLFCDLCVVRLFPVLINWLSALLLQEARGHVWAAAAAGQAPR